MKSMTIRMLKSISSTLVVVVAFSVLTLAANPVPLVNISLSPAAAAPGSAAFSLTVTGTGFVPGATVNWNNSTRTTAFVSSSKLTATIAAADVAKTGTANVTVVNPAPGGGASNTAFLPVAYSTPNIAISSRTSYKSGFYSRSVAVADINGDSFLDIASAGYGCTCVSRFFGNGSGGFQVQKDMLAGGDPVAIAIADVNGDGIPDLLIAGSLGAGGLLSVLLGTGHGAFESHVDYTSSEALNNLVLADINGDGNLDAVASTGGSAGSGDLVVFFGAGNGTFMAGVTIANSHGVINPQFGDFNGDGILDIAGVADLFAYGVVMLGNGDGTFQAPVIIDNNTSTVTYVIPADLNGDGKLDLVATTNLSAVTTLDVFLGNGNGAFIHKQDLLVQTQGNTNIVLGDFNGDGNLDALLNDPSGVAPNDLVLGNGDGTFQPDFLLGTTAEENMVAAGDFNRDGRLDLAAVPTEFNRNIDTYLQRQVLLSPTSLDFGNQKVGTRSAPQALTVYNVGKKKINVTGVNVTGISASEFSVTNKCAALPAGKNCPVSVTFAPTATGTASATVNVVTDSLLGTLTASLGGSGTK